MGHRNHAATVDSAAGFAETGDLVTEELFGFDWLAGVATASHKYAGAGEITDLSVGIIERKGFSILGLNKETDEFHTEDGYILIDANGHPVAIIKPGIYREDPRKITTADLVIINAVPGLEREQLIMPTLDKLLVGQENELILTGGVTYTELEKKMAARGVKVTPEVANGQVEYNMPATSTDFLQIQRTITHGLYALIDSTNKNILATSLNPFVEGYHANDNPYVRRIMELLMDNHLNFSEESMEYLNAYGRETVLAEFIEEGEIAEHEHINATHFEYPEGLDLEDLDAKRSTLAYRLRLKYFEWFSACAVHQHSGGMPQEHYGRKVFDTNFLTFMTNATSAGGGIGQWRGVITDSAAAMNGRLSPIFSHKLYHREKVFLTSGAQGMFERSDDGDVLERAAKALKAPPRGVSAGSFDRAIIESNRWHGNMRVRLGIGTAEDLHNDTMIIPEQQAAHLVAQSLDSYYLAYCYKMGISPDERFYNVPEAWREDVNFSEHETSRKMGIYAANRQRMHENGRSADLLRPNGEEVSVIGQMDDYREFMRSFYQGLVSTGEISQETFDDTVMPSLDWLVRNASEPQEYGLEGYLSPDSPNYGVGTMAEHMRADLERLIKEKYGLEADLNKAYPDIIEYYFGQTVRELQANLIIRKYNELFADAA